MNALLQISLFLSIAASLMAIVGWFYYEAMTIEGRWAALGALATMVVAALFFGLIGMIWQVLE